MQTYRLGSNGLIHAPGIVSWAINGYAFEDDQANLRRVISEGWKIPDEAAHALLSGDVEHTVEDDTVVFTVPDL